MATTEMVKITDLLKNLTYSVDAGNDCPGDDPLDFDAWMGLIRDKTSDENFWALVDAIPDEGFTMPVCVLRRYYANPVDGGWTMGNGHHRLIAAILLGLDEIPVFFPDEDDEDYMQVEVTTGDGQDDDYDWYSMTDVDYMLHDILAAA